MNYLCHLSWMLSMSMLGVSTQWSTQQWFPYLFTLKQEYHLSAVGATSAFGFPQKENFFTCWTTVATWSKTGASGA
jgi:hypothetical protein